MKFDTDKTGLETLLLPYQAAALRFIWKHRKAKSREVHYNSVDVLPLNDRRSRAAIIKFLNEMVDLKVLNFKEETGKGGYHKVYSPAPDYPNEDAYKEYMAKQIIVKVKTELWP